MAIYFIRVNEFVKVGHSTNPSARVQTLQTSNPYPVELLGVVPGDTEVEAALHKQLAHLRTNGEWFEDSPEVRDIISHLLAVFPEYTPPPALPQTTTTPVKRIVVRSDIPSDWRLLTQEHKQELAAMTPSEIEETAGVHRRTALRWATWLSKNGWGHG